MKLASAKIKFNPKIAAAQLKKDLEKVANDKRLESEYGRFLTERVRFEARRGRPLNDDRKFPPLSEFSKVRRAENAKNNKTHPAFDPDKSNLTFTGQLLDAIAFARSKRGLFELFVKKSRRNPIKQKSTQRQVVFNSTVDRRLRRGVDSLEYGKRKFVAFSAKGLKSNKQIPKRLRAILRKFLRRQLRRG